MATQRRDPTRRPRVCVIGVGSDDRGDDAAGLRAVRWVRERAPAGVQVLEHWGEPAALLDAWNGADAAVLVDAVVSGAAPGTVHRFDARVGPLPAWPAARSTHALGVAQAVELARALGRLPPVLVVYGIEGQGFRPGDGLSPQVEAAARAAAERVLAELHTLAGRAPQRGG